MGSSTLFQKYNNCLHKYENMQLYSAALALVVRSNEQLGGVALVVFKGGF